MTTTGKRNRRITIQRYGVVGKDDYGGEIKDWADYTTAFAEALFGDGRERREAAQESAAQTATFIVLWTPKTGAVTPLDRIIALGGEWDITSVAPIGLNKEVHITAVRKLA